VDTCVVRKRLSLSDLPWDTVNMVFDYSLKEDYKLFRLNKTFTRLIDKRRSGLTFKQNQVTSRIFVSLLHKTMRTLKTLKIVCDLKCIKKREFEMA